jgi:DNA polymerase-3 subunit epsilon
VLGTATDAEASGEDMERQVTGYVLMLDNITRSFEAESQRDQVLQTLTEGSRASLGNIRAAVETLADYPDMEPAQRDSFINIVRDEVRAMSKRLDATVNQLAGTLKTRWPLEEMLGVDLIQAAQRRIESRVKLRTKLEDVDETIWLRVDSFSLLQGLTYLAARLEENYDIREIRFRLSAEGRLAHLDLIWSGAVVASEVLVNWEIEPMNVGGEASPTSSIAMTARYGLSARRPRSASISACLSRWRRRRRRSIRTPYCVPIAGRNITISICSRCPMSVTSWMSARSPNSLTRFSIRKRQV